MADECCLKAMCKQKELEDASIEGLLRCFNEQLLKAQEELSFYQRKIELVTQVIEKLKS